MGPEDVTGPATAVDTVRRLLADFTRCPNCAAELPASRCPNCRIDLSGPEGRRVGELSLQAGRLLTERDSVLQVLRTRATASPAPAVLTPSTVAIPPAEATPSPVHTPSTVPASNPTMDTAKRPGLGVHGLLVGLGALLLSVAAIGFLVFSWSVLSLSGRAAVIAVATLGVLAVATWLRGRLPETAEAVGALGVVLVLADCWAIRRTGLFGADRADGLVYAGVAAAVCALLLGGWALAARVRAGSWAAVVLAPLSVLLLAARVDADLDSVPAFQLGLLLVAGLALTRELLPAPWRAERQLLRAGAGAALVAIGGSAGFALPGPARAALLLVGGAVLAVAQSRADRPSERLPQLNSRFLRRAWSLAAGLLTGAAALQAGLALADALDLDGVIVLIPVTALPALAVAVAATLPNRRSVALRRTAFGAGTAIVSALAATSLLLLAGWLPLRAALAGVAAWTADPGTRYGDLEPTGGGTTAAWAVALAGLLAIGVSAVLAVRISGWPGWLRRPVRVVAAIAGALSVLVLPLVPVLPVVAVVGCLILLAVLATGLVVGPVGRAHSRTWLIAGWTASALTGTLAVLLAWSSRELSVPATALGVVALLLARRRLPAHSDASLLVSRAPTVLAGLAAVATPFAVAAGAGLAGAPLSLRVVWAGLVGGLSAAALIGLPGWLPTHRPGRVGTAGWTGADRLAAATPGLIAVFAGLLATLPDVVDSEPGGPGWWRPALLAVLLLVALTGAIAIRPAVARTLPVLVPACALAATPLLGALAAAIRAVTVTGDPDWLMLSLLWAAAAAVGAFAIAALVLSGGTAAEPVRRLAAEFGVAGTGLIGLALINGLDATWPVLLVLGAAAAAIAATPDRQRLGWLAGLLLTGSTWSRLAVENVTLVEAYSVPPATALLVLALYRFRKASPRDEPALVAGLLRVAGVGLAPSMIVAIAGPAVRPAVLIGIGAALVLLGGWWQRRGGPVIGAGLAAIGALVAAGTAGLRAGQALDGVTVALTEVEVWTLPAALVLLVAGMTVRPIERLGNQPWWRSLSLPIPLLLALALAGVPSLVAALQVVTPDGNPEPVNAIRVAAVLGLSIVTALLGISGRISGRIGGLNGGRIGGRIGERIGGLAGGTTSSDRIWLVPGAITLSVAATGSGWTIGAGPVEIWTLPLAALLLIHGWSRFDRLNQATEERTNLPTSWPAYGPGLAVLLLPGLLVGWATSAGWPGREIGVITLAGIVLMLGARQRLQAPVLFGGVVLAVQALVLLSPLIGELSGSIPLWGWLAAVGLGLILLGARYETRMRQFRQVRLRLGALR